MTVESLASSDALDERGVPDENRSVGRPALEAEWWLRTGWPTPPRPDAPDEEDECTGRS